MLEELDRPSVFESEPEPQVSMWVPGTISGSEEARAAFAAAGGKFEDAQSEHLHIGPNGEPQPVVKTYPHLKSMTCPPGWRVQEHEKGFPIPTPIVDGLGRLRAVIYFGDHDDSLTVILTGDEQ